MLFHPLSGMIAPLFWPPVSHISVIWNSRSSFSALTCQSTGGHKRSLCYSNCLPTPQLPVLSPLTCGLLNVRSPSNKSFICNDFITTNCLDFSMATETWITPNDTVPLIEAHYSHFHLSQRSGRDGGTAVIHRSSSSAFSCLLVLLTHLKF